MTVVGIVQLRAEVRALREAEDNVRWAVDLARSEGCSWAEIAEILGISRQAAHKRFSKDRS